MIKQYSSKSEEDLGITIMYLDPKDINCCYCEKDEREDWSKPLEERKKEIIEEYFIAFNSGLILMVSRGIYVDVLSDFLRLRSSK